MQKLWAIEKSIEIGKQKLPEILSLEISTDYNLTIAYFPRGSDGKESACNLRDLGSIPGLGRSPVGGHGNPLQYSCLENPMDTGAWWATVHWVTKSRTLLK